MNVMEQSTEKEKDALKADLIKGLEDTILVANDYEELISAHVTKINRIYDIDYHTFTPRS